MRRGRDHQAATESENVLRFAREVSQILRKDLVRFWPIIAGVSFVLLVWRNSAADIVGLDEIQFRMQQFWFAPFVTWLLTGLIVMEDGPVGEQSFLRTRPVGSIALMTAKLLFLFGFLVLLPALFQAHWVATLEPDSWLPFGLRMLVAQAGVVLTAAWVAASSASLGSFAAVGFGGFLAITLFASELGNGTWGQMEVAEPRFLAWALAGLLLTALQYLVRRSHVSILGGGVAFIVVTLAVVASSPPWSPPPPPVDQRVFASPDSVRPFLVELGLDSESHLPSGVGPVASLVAGVAVDVPERLFAFVREVDGRIWTKPPGPVRTLSPQHFPMDFMGPTREDFLGYRVLRYPLRENQPRVFFTEPHLAWGHEAEIDSLLEGADGLTLRLVIDLYEPVIRGLMPLEGGRWATPEGMVTVEPDDGGYADGSVRLWMARERPLRPGEEVGETNFVYPLVNRARRELLPPAQMPSGPGIPQKLTLPGVRVGGQWGELEFHRVSTSRRVTDTIPEGWLDDAELMILGRRYVGTVTRTLRRSIPEWPEWDRAVRVDSLPGWR